MGGETEKELMHALEDAIKREESANELYIRCASLANKQALKDMFLKLADEETKHKEILTKEYHDIKKRLGLKIFHADDES